MGCELIVDCGGYHVNCQQLLKIRGRIWANDAICRSMNGTKSPKTLAIADYTYDLPDHRIASYPLSIRDASRLLVYESGNIHETTYRQLADQVPAGHLLVFNKTKVVEARIYFTKPTGGVIELFCLEPHQDYPDVTTAMLQTGQVRWNCLVGGASKWKHGTILEKSVTHGDTTVHLTAAIDARNQDTFSILFTWTPDTLSFAELLHAVGVIPIPPYLKRDCNQQDSDRYQTIYAEMEGSVAAPTAGLHFTDQVFKELSDKGISRSFVTLHVGAGTFKPVKSEYIADHDMHAEYIEVDIATIEELLSYEGRILAVGTTSLRTLESLYWMGVKAYVNPRINIEGLEMKQWEVYEELGRHQLTAGQSLISLLSWMKKHQIVRILCKTQILIAPGYHVRMIRGLITNFHQPQSTLLLLVAALIGNDWKKVYAYALENDFRFLSYGDGSLLWCNKP